MASQPTNNFDFQNFYGSTLSSDITAGTLTIPLANVPTPSEGILIIDPDSATPEVIYYTSKSGSSVTCASDGRGWDSSAAATHLQGTTVIMAPTAYVLRMLKSGSLFDTTKTGWTSLGMTPTYSTTNGNHSYTLATATDQTGVISKGMRLKFDRSTAAPIQCTLLNGSTQFYNKTSPAGLTFTNNFVVSAWIKLTAYGAAGSIASRYNGTSGWRFSVQPNGTLQLAGFNASGSNFSLVASQQSVPLNRWVHVSAQLDMASFTATPTTSYTMIDAVDVPATVSRAGTNPTALIQAGNLEIGSDNGGTEGFPGKLAQVAVYSAKVTEATIAASMNQTLLGSETNIASAYTFNNSVADLSTNANTLTANGSAVATNTDSPFAQGATAGVTEYGIVTNVTSSTITVHIAEGSAVPATGTMTNFFYSPHKAPYNFPSQRNKWRIEMIDKTSRTQAATGGTWYNLGQQISIPIGDYLIGYSLHMSSSISTAGTFDVRATLSTVNNTAGYPRLVSRVYGGYNSAASAIVAGGQGSRDDIQNYAAQTTIFLNVSDVISTTNIAINGDLVETVVYAEPAYL